MEVRIEAARRDDLPAIRALLDQHRLPHAAIERFLDDVLVARAGDRVVGCAALERYDAAGLLRSVAVAEARRGTGLGTRLTAAALDHARAHGIRTVYLLTETAAGFFPRFGFHAVPRPAVAPAVRQSVEFTSACPETALAMVTEL
jgi:amino-acid N-acetyltransferase